MTPTTLWNVIERKAGLCASACRIGEAGESESMLVISSRSGGAAGCPGNRNRRVASIVLFGSRINQWASVWVNLFESSLPRKGAAIVTTRVTERVASGPSTASERAIKPPMLCPTSTI